MKMDERYRLKLKIGVHEFDAEGDPAVVQAQFEAFKELVKMAGAAAALPPPSTFTRDEKPLTPAEQPTNQTPLDIDASLGKIMHVEDKIVSLTVPAATIDDAVMLVLYGQKILRSSDSVSGYEVMQGLTLSGQGVNRVDRVLDKAGQDGSVIVIGQRRGRRYRLTNAGMAKARKLAADLIAIVA